MLSSASIHSLAATLRPRAVLASFSARHPQVVFALTVALPSVILGVVGLALVAWALAMLALQH